MWLALGNHHQTRASTCMCHIFITAITSEKIFSASTKMMWCYRSHLPLRKFYDAAIWLGNNRFCFANVSHYSFLVFMVELHNILYCSCSLQIDGNLCKWQWHSCFYFNSMGAALGATSYSVYNFILKILFIMRFV